MADKDILDIDSLDDFELPPLPKLPAKSSEGSAGDDAKNTAKKDAERSPRHEKKAADSAEKAKSDTHKDTKPAETKPDKASESGKNDLELPPLREPEPEKPVAAKSEEMFKPDDDPIGNSDDLENFDFDDNYDPDLDEIDAGSVVLEEMTRVAPIRSRKEESARNMKESIRMNDLSMDTAAPVLDDLSDEYAAPEKKAESLLDRDKLDAEEKLILKQRLQEDLGRRPENFNARASKNLQNRLMEEKKLKIAKKGFKLSFIPIILGIVGAVLCYLNMNWGNYQWFQYVSVFALAGAVILLIKSNHAKIFGVILYTLTLLMYVGPGLVLYALNETMQAEPDYLPHLLCAAAASVMNIVSVIILTKNEAVNIYYTTKFSRK